MVGASVGRDDIKMLRCKEFLLPENITRTSMFQAKAFHGEVSRTNV